MIARLATKADAAGVSRAWEDGFATIAARWPASAGGAAAVPHLLPADAAALIQLPHRLCIVADDSAASGPSVAAWIGVRHLAEDASIMAVEQLAVAFGTVGTPAQQRAATITRITAAFPLMLRFLVTQVGPATQIHARMPLTLPTDTTTLRTIDVALTAMMVKNGLVATNDGAFRSWTLTSAHITQGLA